MKKSETILVTLGIIFIAFNLRAPITAVGSLIDMIQSDYPMSSAWAGMITTLPLLAFAVVSPFVAKSVQRYGFSNTMFAGLALIALGECVRSYTTLSGIFIGTVILGIGIAIGNVLIPSIIKLKFPTKIGLMSSVYTSNMCLSAALGAGISIPLAKGLNFGWKHSLAFWILLAAATLIIWALQTQAYTDAPAQTQQKNSAASSTTSIWFSKLAWILTIFMGLQSLIFYAMVAWLPTMLIAKGQTENMASVMALIYQMVAIPVTIIVPILGGRKNCQSALTATVCAIYLAGMLLLLFGHTTTVLLCSIVLLSIGMGATISLAIAFISLRSPNALRASQLSGMTQSAGYLVSSIGPFILGYLFDIASSWTLPLYVMTACVAILIPLGYFAGQNKEVKA